MCSEAMRAATAERLQLEHDLRKELEGGQFELHYQPQVEVRTGAIEGALLDKALASKAAKRPAQGAPKS